jgi:hypothetical protein
MKLDRIKLNAMVDLLKDQEMKMMKGGSSYCWEGEKLFSCGFAWYGSYSYTTGYVCGATNYHAESLIEKTLKKQGFYVGADIKFIACF